MTDYSTMVFDDVDFKALVDEAVAMDNCLADYVGECANKRVYLLSVCTAAGRSVVGVTEGMRLGQHLGYANRPAPDEHVRLLANHFKAV